MSPRFDELPGDGRKLCDALLVVDKAIGSKDAAVAVISVGTEANVASNEEVRKVARYSADRHRRRICVAAKVHLRSPLHSRLHINYCT